MSTLEKVMQMKQTGMSEWDIGQALKKEGISPKEINEALSQSNIKQAVGQNTSEPEEPVVDQEMQPSIMSSTQENSAPQTTQGTIPSSYNPSTVPYDEYSQENQGQMQQVQEYQDYREYPEYQPQQSVDIETINDIAEQIFEEKTEKLRGQISTIMRFKEDIGADVERMDGRLKKIETTFESLQVAILKRVGDYGEDIKNISKEMHETQNSFSKIINPLTENIQELRRITGIKSPLKSEEQEEAEEKNHEQVKEEPNEQEPQERSERRNSRKEKDSFEHFLR